MKISVININNYHFLRGGSETYYFGLGRLLEKRGHRVLYFATKPPQNIRPIGTKAFVEPINVERPGPLDLIRFIYSNRAATALRKSLRGQRLDIAHLHIYYGQLTTSILSPLKDAGITIIQSLHEYKLICPVYTMVSGNEICEACRGNQFWHALPRRCNRKSLARTLLSVVESYLSLLNGSREKVDLFIAVSDFLRRKMIEFGVPDEKITTIHNFIDSASLKPSHRPGEHFLYFGRLERVKGIFALIEAAAEIKDVPLYIVGQGEARADLCNVIARRELKHIHLLGFRQGEELHELVRRAICFIIPSEWYENCPMSVLESYGLGTPVIGSAIGGIPELIEDKADGFLVPPGDADSLRERMLWMARHRKEAVDMGLLGRRKIETRFGSEVHYEKILNAYRKFM